MVESLHQSLLVRCAHPEILPAEVVGHAPARIAHRHAVEIRLPGAIRGAEGHSAARKESLSEREARS